MLIRLPGALLALAIAAHAPASEPPSCASTLFLIETNFESGKFDTCTVSPDGSFDITIEPEDRGVTIEQPWYAFRVRTESPGDLRVRLHFPAGYARFWPKLSRDGSNWTRAPDSAVDIAASKKSLSIAVALQEGPLWVAAQELLPSAWYDDWFAELAAHDAVAIDVIGQSVAGRPIRLARTARRPETLILLGRQHPAEVPGALAMRDFVDVVLADSELARQFRERFSVLVMPLLNPDGVANGHWRHNAGRTDLNRDWGPFTQPETRAVANVLADLAEQQTQPRLMLDFHATKSTAPLLFYTQTAAELSAQAQFTAQWFAAVQARLPDLEFQVVPGPSDQRPNAKGYFYRRYGIPAFTYELNDEVDREQLHASTPVFAEELMRAMLQAE